MIGILTVPEAEFLEIQSALPVDTLKVSSAIRLHPAELLPASLINGASDRLDLIVSQLKQIRDR